MARLVASRIVLAVRDLSVSTRYYIDGLGFTRDFGDGSDGWSFISRDSVRFMLGECRDERPAGELGNHSWIAYLTADDVDALFDELNARAVEGISHPPITQPWGMREFGVTTPDGHRITFGQELGSA